MPISFPALAAIAAFVAFLPALSNGFVNWDDEFNYLNNVNYRGLGTENIKWMFTDLQGHYMPLTWVTLGADYLIWGLNPMGYHLTSMILHAINAALFYWIIAALLRAAWGKGMRRVYLHRRTGRRLFFGVHPLRVESVAWATERRDVLSGFFFFCFLSRIRG